MTLFIVYRSGSNSLNQPMDDLMPLCEAESSAEAVAVPDESVEQPLAETFYDDEPDYSNWFYDVVG